jgi:hypothetical protein
MTFQQKLRRLTEERTKAKLSRRAGLPSTAINDYVVKGTRPLAENALKLARVLGVSTDWLIDDEQEWPPVPAEGKKMARVA